MLKRVSPSIPPAYLTKFATENHHVNVGKSMKFMYNIGPLSTANSSVKSLEGNPQKSDYVIYD